MLTPERIEEFAIKHEAFGFGRVDARGLTTHGFDPEGLHEFTKEIQAAATAEARALVGQMLEALRYMLYQPSDQYDDKHAAKLMKAAESAGAAWLGEAQKGDGHHG